MASLVQTSSGKQTPIASRQTLLKRKGVTFWVFGKVPSGKLRKGPRLVPSAQ